MATHGYYKNPEATNASFRDGWFYTGDLGYFDEEGYLFVAGRKKDMVKSGGISIYPLEIESVIYSHPDILEAAVIGVPDPQWGEAVNCGDRAQARRRDDGRRVASDFVKSDYQRTRFPNRWSFVDSLPHTEVGKVNKVKLREMILTERGRQFSAGRTHRGQRDTVSNFL